MLNEDYKEILQILLSNKVKFLVVGAYAMGAYGYPRATGDFDIWVESSGVTEKTFEEKGIIFQIGVAPRRIDIITRIDGVTFKEAYKKKEIIEIEGLRIPFLSKENLIKNKQSTGREKDKLDANYLRENKDI